MSVHLVPHTIVEPVAARVAQQLPGATVQIGTPDANGDTALTITPDLTPAQLAAFNDAVVSIRAGVEGLTAADIDGLRAYLAVGSPTLAQTASATKALIRTLRALIKDA